MGRTDCFDNQRLEGCRLFCKLTNIPNDRLVKGIFTWSKSHGKCWEKRFLKFIHEIELSHLFEQDTSCVANTVKLCKSKLIKRDKVKWRTNLFNDVGHANGNKLRTYRLYKTELQIESYVKLPLHRDHRLINICVQVWQFAITYWNWAFCSSQTPRWTENLLSLWRHSWTWTSFSYWLSLLWWH